MNAVFMGTPEMAVPCLKAVAGWADRLRVMTQPDRPRGRSRRPQPSPVKQTAEALGLEVCQPERLRGNAEALSWLAAEAVDVVVVVAYGLILPSEVLALPRLGCVNVHFSLLPRWRGAAPVQRAIMAGDRETGVATMLMDEGLDTGDVLLVERVAIGEDETAGELGERLAHLAPPVLLATLDGLAAGTLTPTPQDESAATPAPRLSKDEGRLDWSQPASELARRVRGVTPWPGAAAEVAGEPVKVLRARVGDGAGAPGELLAIEPDRGMLVAAGERALWLEVVQAPGRQATAGDAYAHGRRLTVD